jgi:hypothetical protein
LVGGELWVPAGQFLRSGRDMANAKLSAAKRTRVVRRAFILHVLGEWRGVSEVKKEQSSIIVDILEGRRFKDTRMMKSTSQSTAVILGKPMGGTQASPAVRIEIPSSNSFVHSSFIHSAAIINTEGCPPVTFARGHVAL